MARKKITEADREVLKKELADTAMKLYLERGIPNVYLADVIKEVSISKAYFYTLYSSYGELLSVVLESTNEGTLKILDDILADDSIPFEDEAYEFLIENLNYKNHPLFVANLTDSMTIFKRQNFQTFQNFQKNHVAVYDTILNKLGIPEEKLNRKMFGNTFLALLMDVSLSDEDLALSFPEEREAAVKFQAKMLADRLTSMREK